MNTAKIFMAFAKGNETTDSAIVKRYVGVAPCYVLGVNPNKAKLEEIYGTTLENAPEYLSTVDVDGKTVSTARIDFIVKTDPDKSNGIEMLSKVALFLRKEYRFNRDKTKVQVIDKYGRTAWVTKEEAAAHAIPVYTNGPANLDADYRPCYVGEEELTNFIKTYLNIPNVMKYVDKKWVMVDNPDECLARLENVDKFFTGDFSELNTIVNLQPNNKIKLLFGVKTNDEGKQYQAVYTQMFLKNGVQDYSKLDKDLQDRKAAGAYATTEFFIGDLKEYTVEATNFASTPVSENPFGDTVGMSDNPWA